MKATNYDNALYRQAAGWCTYICKVSVAVAHAVTMSGTASNTSSSEQKYRVTLDRKIAV